MMEGYLIRSTGTTHGGIGIPDADSNFIIQNNYHGIKEITFVYFKTIDSYTGHIFSVALWKIKRKA